MFTYLHIYLVIVGILMGMMVLFEIPIIAVLYIWCQLNKGITCHQMAYGGYNLFLRYNGSIFLWCHVKGAIFAMGPMPVQYDCKRWWNDGAHWHLCWTRLFLPQISICSRFWRARFGANSTGKT